MRWMVFIPVILVSISSIYSPLGSITFDEVVITDKLAIIIYPYDSERYPWTQDLTVRAENLLIDLGYNIYRIDELDDIKRFIALNTVVLFIGHSNPRNRDEMWSEYGMIRLSVLMKNIKSTEIYMFTNTCAGGTWLEYASENKIIVSAVNDTKGIIEVHYENGVLATPTPNLTGFLELCKDYSIEQSFDIWREQLLAYYNLDVWDGHYQEYRPVFFDGVKGETWL